MGLKKLNQKRINALTKQNFSHSTAQANTATKQQVQSKGPQTFYHLWTGPSGRAVHIPFGEWQVKQQRLVGQEGSARQGPTP